MLTRVTPTTYSMAISVDDAKAHSRIDATAEDSLLEDYIKAATRYAETYTGLTLLDTDWTYTSSGFPGSRLLELPTGPIIEVDSITYLDTAGSSQTFSSDNYSLVKTQLGGYVQLEQDSEWPETYGDVDDVTVTFAAGFGDEAADIPPDIRLGVRQLVAHWYEIREPVIVGVSIAPVSMSAERLLYPYRRLKV